MNPLAAEELSPVYLVPPSSTLAEKTASYFVRRGFHPIDYDWMTTTGPWRGSTAAKVAQEILNDEHRRPLLVHNIPQDKYFGLKIEFSIQQITELRSRQQLERIVASWSKKRQADKSRGAKEEYATASN